MAYDPGEHTVDEVKEWVDEHRNQASRVRERETEGRARSTLLSWFDAEFDLAPTPRAANPGEEHITLLPPSAKIGDADLTLTVTGFDSTFNVRSEIIFNGAGVPTTLVDAAHVTTVLHPSGWSAPGLFDVWVWTDGTHDTAAAQFTVNPSSGQPQPPDWNAMQSNALLTAQLRAAGISGEPIRWAFDRYQAAITAIRAANTGFGTVQSAQGVLDSSFPNNQILASNVCVTPPGTTTFSTKAHDGKSHLLLDDDPQLPQDNITWLIDGVIVAHGHDVDVDMIPPGEHVVEVQVAVAGHVYSRRETVGEPISTPVMEDV